MVKITDAVPLWVIASCLIVISPDSKYVNGHGDIRLFINGQDYRCRAPTG